ncbi:hypothetical protein QR98_0094790 [Sarcoptes scabiei]|uniref:Uncharacterized protein n=1 Tax=Sarcoptes scabiei TaxID=52283 RepID=A0A132AIV3_SARSC|nr:hypothetical protein QR98_0094790 [Sarcoptes scabiei]
MPVIAIDRHYYLLPSGDLLIAAINSNDLRRQFRCRMAHQFTGERIDSINWARVKIRDQSNHISYRPRFNLDVSLRQTLTIDDGGGDQDQSDDRIGTDSIDSYLDHQGMSHLIEDDKLKYRNHSSFLFRSKLEALSTKPIDIYCSFDAQPPPNISWYFLSYFDYWLQKKSHRHPSIDLESLVPLRMDPKMSALDQNFDPHYIITTRHLRINQPTMRDIGTYICLANNSHFQVRHETDLLSRRLLRLNLGMKKMERKQSKTFLDEKDFSEDFGPFIPGDTIILSCNLTHILTINGGGPDYEQWFQSSIMVTMKQSAPKFQQTFNEQIVMGQKDVSLKCVADGVPAPSIIWQRNRINLTDLTGNLIITTPTYLQSPSSSSTSIDRNGMNRQSSQSSSGNNQFFRYKTGTFQHRLSPKQSRQSSVLKTNHYGTQNNNNGQSNRSNVLMKSEFSRDRQKQLQQSRTSSSSSWSSSSVMFRTVSYLNISSIRSMVGFENHFGYFFLFFFFLVPLSGFLFRYVVYRERTKRILAQFFKRIIFNSDCFQSNYSIN